MNSLRSAWPLLRGAGLLLLTLWLSGSTALHAVHHAGEAGPAAVGGVHTVYHGTGHAHADGVWHTHAAPVVPDGGGAEPPADAAATDDEHPHYRADASNRPRSVDPILPIEAPAPRLLAPMPAPHSVRLRGPRATRPPDAPPLDGRSAPRAPPTSFA